MTVKEAIIAKVPFSLSEETLELLLVEQGLDASDEYEVGVNSREVLQATVNALYQGSTITKEKDNGSEIQYDSAAIMALIRRYENELRSPEARPLGVNKDITNYW